MDKTAIPLMILVVNLEVKSISVITNYNRILVKNSQEYIFHQTNWFKFICRLLN